jgi:hypothetical protein
MRHNQSCVDHEISVQRLPNTGVLVEGSMSTPTLCTLFRAPWMYMLLLTPQPCLPTSQSGLHTPSENPPSRYPKAFVSIDFGATHSGVSYAISTTGEVRQILAWPESSHSFSKIPTCLVYDTLGDIRTWDLEATDINLKKGWVPCEC